MASARRRGRRGGVRVWGGAARDPLRVVARDRAARAPRSAVVTALRGARVLVTGAGGFVGPHVARELAVRGARVYGVGIGAPPADAPIADWREADLTDPAAARGAIAASAPDAIVHLAGQSSAAHSFEAPEETFRANVTGTWTLLEAVREHAPGARVVVVSTSEVYGPIASGTRAAEDAPFQPASPYALSKAAAEEVARAYAEAHALDVVRARPFSHTGPGQAPRFVVPSFAQQIAAIEAGRAEPVLRVGNLDVTRDLTDVREIVAGYCALLERGRRGAVYNLCRGEGAPLRSVVDELAGMARVRIRIEVDPARLRPSDTPWLVGDPSLTADELGWRAERPLRETLQDVLDEWRAKAS
ncbi:MAG: NAD-dependent epimerase/dehydratase family protein [Deltaproteobacteria bacterium]|nr:MAG: NAD-dependent epimerase/dehydratase family protein [Deltaproteobacteria bacterium]